ncbi:hypothetical protein ES705_18388 [subsurface metagenome]
MYVRGIVLTNKHPQARLVSVPSGFLPMIIAERDRLGLFTTTDMMGSILEKYFGKRPPPVAIAGVNEPKKMPAIKGVKKDGI